MPLSLALPTPLEYFASLVQSDAQFPLLEAAASVAMDDYPALDVQSLLGDMDLLCARLSRKVARDAPALERLRAVNQFFFTDLGFAGNVLREIYRLSLEDGSVINVATGAKVTK